ncbi:hypothetical protein RchiOBHm_Chr4g0387681 [Rosa chinensis]|uniref:Uncharacterized protein n=1 Tax=Rosa chinensis TaxID=74649 RepID=A0A2P6QPK7_ROSCH|nr:hypothetical protein RchiOBHm_Chr4g0387681 [Rosa chinensis]
MIHWIGEATYKSLTCLPTCWTKGLGGVDEKDVRKALKGRSEAEVKRVIDILMGELISYLILFIELASV